MKKKKGILINWETGEPIIKNGDFVIGETSEPIPPAKWENDTDTAIKNIFPDLTDTDLGNPLVKDFIGQFKNNLNQFKEGIRDDIEQHNYELAKEQKEQIQPLKQENENLTNTLLQLAKTNSPKPKQTTSEKQPYSLECDYSANKIKSDLYPKFSHYFDCTETDIINFLSENITTQITAKQWVKLKTVVYFIDWLKRKNHIKATQYTNIIDKTKCVIWNNKPLTATQLKDTRKQLKKELPPPQTDNILD